MDNKPRFIGVGVGPGDPELITLKAARYIHQADVISFIANEQGHSQAKQIAHRVLQECHQAEQYPIVMPMCDDRSQANAVYDQASEVIKQAVIAGKTVVFLCEGDPLFFGSFAYLLERLEPEIPCEVVAGISSIHAASALLKNPLTLLQESFAVVSGRHSIDTLTTTLKHYDSVAIMKAGRSRQKILKALAMSERTADAQYMEYIGRAEQRIVTDVSTLEDEAGPYFSLFIVTKTQRYSDR